MIEIKDLHKTFITHSNFGKKKIQVLNNINLKVKEGELFALVGPNGAGKTTIIRILCGLVVPNQGQVCIKGYNVVVDEYKVKSIIGLVTGEERSFYWRLTAVANLEFFARLQGLRGKGVKRRISELADLLKIESELNKRFQELSTGNKQRLAIVRALLNNPEVIFLDEPTKNLDPIISDKLMTFIKEELVKKQGKTIFFVTQNLNETTFTDRIALISKGKIVASGNINELRQKIGKPDAIMKEIYQILIKS